MGAGADTLRHPAGAAPPDAAVLVAEVVAELDAEVVAELVADPSAGVLLFVAVPLLALLALLPQPAIPRTTTAMARHALRTELKKTRSPHRPTAAATALRSFPASSD